MPFRLGYLAVISLLFFSFLMCQSSLPPNAPALGPQLFPQQKQLQALEDRILAQEETWINQKWESMSPEERLGQLFMVAAYPLQGKNDEARMKRLIQKEHLGGVVLFKGPPTRAASLCNKYQAWAPKVPLLVAIDGEWGLAMRLDSIINYPRQLLFGALPDNRLIYDFGKEVARQAQHIGIHINFAPVVDINNNAANPVIGDRSFGEQKRNVTAKAYQYMRGMQDKGLMACAKHFPGHGDTDVDSHYDLPQIKHPRSRLDSLELYPFRQLIPQGLGSIMVAHLNIPALDPRDKRPTTLSYATIQKLLKEELNFKGLVITDAMNMQGVAKHYGPGQADVEALKAGNDILLMSQRVAQSKKMILAALKKGDLSWEDLEQRIRKILRAKYRAGLANYKPVSTKNVVKNINNQAAQDLYKKILGQSLTLVDNPDSLLPLRQIKGRKIASLCIGSGRKNSFQLELQRYGIQQHFYAGTRISAGQERRLLQQLGQQEVVFVALDRLRRKQKDRFGVSTSVERFVKKLSKKTKVVLIAFGSPYSLGYFEEVPYLSCAYVNDRSAQIQAARAMVGAQSFMGQLPVSASKNLRAGLGVKTQIFRMPHAESPESMGMRSDILNQIDEIAEEAIRKKATPGCQVLVAKSGKIVFHKAYGHHTYAKRRPQRLDDVYDLASVTKVAATTMTLMHLYERGLIDLDAPLGQYIPELKGSNKANLKIRAVLAHQAGLKPWIPFYAKTLDENKRPMDSLYRKKPQDPYQVRIAEGLYFHKDKVKPYLWDRIIEQNLRGRTNYKYSDLGFYLFARLVEEVSGQTLDEYVQEHFYAPMGLEYTGFNPLNRKISKSQIIPSEEDKYYRYQKVQGDVHDMGAAMLAGVSGHAGLFSQGQELAAIYQLWLNGGSYKGRQYLKESTIALFTKQYSPRSRRGLGFDRKEITDPNASINVAKQASPNTFGHLGFTGIGAWADPDNELIYIFLSNRTYPDSENMQLIRLDIRTRIHELCYQALGE